MGYFIARLQNAISDEFVREFHDEKIRGSESNIRRDVYIAFPRISFFFYIYIVKPDKKKRKKKAGIIGAEKK